MVNPNAVLFEMHTYVKIHSCLSHEDPERSFATYIENVWMKHR